MGFFTAMNFTTSVYQAIAARFRKLRKSLRDPRACVLTAWLAATAVAFLITAVRGVPAPSAHDEFAYLLGADTLASGKIVNETHPMWEHFESFHVIHQPNYVSKYQPAQSLTLALGQILGHPIVGSCLATGVSIAALVWMLIGWLPRKHHWMVCLFAVFHPGLQFIWGQSYWSGAVALTGSSMLVGAFGRLTGRMETRYAMTGAFGALLLANSRPFEGAILTLSIVVALIWKLFRNAEWSTVTFMKRVMVPAIAVLGLGFGIMLSYNFSATGHAFKMPYQVHEATYGWTPLFLWETAGEKPEYRHQVMESSYVNEKHLTETSFGSLRDIFENKSQVALLTARFFCSEVGLVALLGLPWLLRKPRYQMALALLIPVFLAAMATPWSWAQYFAPAAPLLLLFLFGGLIEIWNRTRRRPAIRLSIRVVAPMLLMIWTVSLVTFSVKSAKFGWAQDRVAVTKWLNREEGKDLVLVHYADDHNSCNEWVYNAADIDAADIVWAREMSDEQRKKLLDYFRDRKVWVVDADAKPPVVRPFHSVEVYSLQAGFHSR